MCGILYVLNAFTDYPIVSSVAYFPVVPDDSTRMRAPRTSTNCATRLGSPVCNSCVSATIVICQGTKEAVLHLSLGGEWRSHAHVTTMQPKGSGVQWRIYIPEPRSTCFILTPISIKLPRTLGADFFISLRQSLSIAHMASSITTRAGTEYDTVAKPYPWAVLKGSQMNRTITLSVFPFDVLLEVGLPSRCSAARLATDLQCTLCSAQVFSHLHPIDLLNLARTCKSFRRYLMSKKKAKGVWRAARGNVELPDCPAHLSEPAYANLAFVPYCHV